MRKFIERCDDKMIDLVFKIENTIRGAFKRR